MAKCLLKQPKCGHLNIECGNSEHFRQFACEYPKKYQKKLTKVIKLVDIITMAIAIFETSISKAFNDCKIDER